MFLTLTHYEVALVTFCSVPAEQTIIPKICSIDMLLAVDLSNWQKQLNHRHHYHRLCYCLASLVSSEVTSQIGSQRGGFNLGRLEVENSIEFQS